MKPTLIQLILILATGLSFLEAAEPSKADTEKAERFINGYIQGITLRDMKARESMVYWEGASARDRRPMEEALRNSLLLHTNVIASNRVSLAPVDEAALKRDLGPGVRLNLKPRWILSAAGRKYPVLFYVGEKDDKLYIACPLLNR